MIFPAVTMKAPRTKRSTVIGVAALTSLVFAGTVGFAFVFGGISEARSATRRQANGLRGAGIDAQGPVQDDSACDTSSWKPFITFLAACGLVARITCAPAVADADMTSLLTPPPKIVINPDVDPEESAVEARATYLKAKEDEKSFEKQARLEERMATRRVAEEKVKAEAIIASNVKSELDRIRAERTFAEQVAMEKENQAKTKAINANQFAEYYTQDKRSAKVLDIASTGPKKQLLAKALANRTSADEEARNRKEFADKALQKLEEADKLASDKKLAVEKAVNDLAAVGLPGA